MADDEAPPPPAPVIRGDLVPRREMSLTERKMDVIRRADERVRRKATRIVEGALAGADIDDYVVGPDGKPQPYPRPEGWSAKKFRLAQDGRRDEKHTPTYLKMATRVLESYQRRDAASPAPPALGADIKVYVKGDATFNFVYPVVDVTEGEGK